MHIIILPQQVGGLVVNELISILKVKGSIPINDMGCDQWWDLDWIFLT
jgi:hypothetical protein